MAKESLILELPCGGNISWDFQDEYARKLLYIMQKGLAPIQASSGSGACRLKVNVSQEKYHSSWNESGWDESEMICYNQLLSARLVSEDELNIQVSDIGGDLRTRCYQLIRVIWYAFLPLLLKRQLVVVHGALLARGNRGVVLTGPSGIGKSTCAKRVSHPWEALSDDVVLISRYGDEYFAQGLPTWSRFINGTVQPELDWNRTVRLTGIFQLIQDRKDRVCEVTLLEKRFILLRQFWDIHRMWWRNSCDMYGAMMDFAAQMAPKVHIGRLHCSLTGEFWKELEPFVAKNEMRRKDVV